MPDVEHVGPDEDIRFGLLQAMRRPAGMTGHGERGREDLGRKSYALEHGRGVVLNVGLEDEVGFVFGKKS